MTDDNIPRIDVHELQTKRVQTPNLCLIDVREPHEWQQICIPGARLMPKDSVRDQIAQAVADKSTPIYIHCRSGVRSLEAAKTMMSLGYTNVYSVDGGILDWSQSGYDVSEGTISSETNTFQ